MIWLTESSWSGCSKRRLSVASKIAFSASCSPVWARGRCRPPNGVTLMTRTIAAQRGCSDHCLVTVYGDLGAAAGLRRGDPEQDHAHDHRVSPAPAQGDQEVSEDELACSRGT